MGLEQEASVRLSRLMKCLGRAAITSPDMPTVTVCAHRLVAFENGKQHISWVDRQRRRALM